jgi:hypothetical protein
MDKEARRAVLNSAAAGGFIAVGLFFVSWWANAFDTLVFFQLPGFLVSSFLWGFPGFGHRVTAGFPFLMIAVNVLFYGFLVYLFTLFVNRLAQSKNGHSR